MARPSRTRSTTSIGRTLRANAGLIKGLRNHARALLAAAADAERVRSAIAAFEAAKIPVAITYDGHSWMVSVEGGSVGCGGPGTLLGLLDSARKLLPTQAAKVGG